MKDLSELQKLVALLGDWPEHFSADEERHGLAMLETTRRAKIIDEAVFRLVCLWAGHMAAHDRISRDLDKQDFTATQDKYLSGQEQRRAFHENKMLVLQRELLATPYARAKSGMSAQSDFLDLLSGPPEDQGNGGKVMPFTPMGRKGRA